MYYGPFIIQQIPTATVMDKKCAIATFVNKEN